MEIKGYRYIFSSGAQYFLPLSLEELLIIPDNTETVNPGNEYCMQFYRPLLGPSLCKFYMSVILLVVKELLQVNTRPMWPKQILYHPVLHFQFLVKVSRNCSCCGPLRTGPPFLHMKNFAETTAKKFWDLVIDICRTISTSVLCIHSEGSLDVQPMMQLSLFQLKQHDLFSFIVLACFHRFRGNVQSGMWDHTYWQISPPGKWKYYSHRTLQLFSMWLHLRSELISSVILLIWIELYRNKRGLGELHP